MAKSSKDVIEEDFFDGFDPSDRSKLDKSDFLETNNYSAVGPCEIVGIFNESLMRIDFSGLQIACEVNDYEGDVCKVQVPHFNQRYVLLGFTDGKVEIRDTETLEKIYLLVHFKAKILDM